MRVAILVNPKSGRGKAVSAATYIERFLERRGLNPVLHYSNSIQRTQELANHISFRFPKVISVGGDGTLNEVINGIVGTDCQLGVIPTGDVNVLAVELGIPHDIEKAAAIAVSGDVKKIDLGRVNDRYFSVMCGIGLDAEIISQVKPIVKEVFSEAAYPMTGIKSLINYKPEHLLIKIDNSLLSEGYYVVVSNSKNYGGTFSIARKADITDGYLDVCIFKNKSVASFIRHIAAIAAGKNLSSKGFEYYRAKEVQVQAEKPVLIQTDGEVVGTTPADIKVVPKKLQIMMPKL